MEWLLVSDGLIWVFHKTADLLGFSHTTISRVYKEWSEKENISSERQLCGRKCLDDVRGQRRMGKLVKRWLKGNSNSNNHSLQPRYAEYHLWTHNMSNPEADGLQQQKTTPVPLLSAKNRKRRLKFTQAHQNWTIEDWKHVAWSDESRFLLRHSDGRVRIWRKEHKAWIHSALSQRFRLVVVV